MAAGLTSGEGPGGEALFTALIFCPLLGAALLGGRLTGVRPLQAGAWKGATLARGASLGAFGILIATAYGWQATGSTIAALRSIVHALRGWPTPFAAAINTQITKFDGEGGASDPAVVDQLRLVGRQVARFAPLTQG